MKPNFALSLSQEGIGLLHRTADRWSPVGEVDLSAPDWAEQLAGLRRTATMLDHSCIRCKVIIPNDQIKYLTLQFDPATDQNADQTARAALAGATPYAVDDLVFDISVGDTSVQVAAVARETLSEAEEFAAQHGFHPISLVADPSPEVFAGEPFFGPATVATRELAKEETVEPDDFAVSQEPEHHAPEDQHAADANSMEPDLSPAGFVSRRIVPTFRTEAHELRHALAPDLAAKVATSVSGNDESGSSTDVTQLGATVSDPSRRHGATEANQTTFFAERETAALAGRRDSLVRVIAVVFVVVLAIAGFASGAFNAGWNTLLIGLHNEGPELRFAAPPQPSVPIAAATDPANLSSSEAGAPEQNLSDEDAAVLDALALPDPSPTPQSSGAAPSLENVSPEINELQANYAVFGIWPRAPDVPRPAALVDLNNFYIPSIDVVNPQFDAVALPALTTYQSDSLFLAPNSPAPAGTRFVLDSNDMVVPTPQGALNPDGIPVFSGPPPIRQPDTLVQIENPGADLEQRIRLAAFRPVVRPADLIERNERAAFGGQTRAELGQYRPKIRPQSIQESALAEASLVSLDADGALIRATGGTETNAPTKRAVLASLRPGARPANFGEIVARAQGNTKPAPVTAVARVTPRNVAPSIPSSASVAREATQSNALNLRKVNLIGVYGTPSSRRALVRLGNGRYRKVEVGDRIDGGRVSAIGESELRYQKSGRAVVLRMPKG